MNRPAPDAQSPDLRIVSGERIRGQFLFVLFAGVLVSMIFSAISYLRMGDPAAGSIFAGVALVFLPLGLVMWRDARAKFAWRIVLRAGSMALFLPPGRVFAGVDDAVFETVPYANLKRVEWRDEVVTVAGISVDTEVWALRLKDGRIIILGENRPIPHSGQMTDDASRAGKAIAARAGVPVRRMPRVSAAASGWRFWKIARPAWPG
ncbi:MAG: hypothetical protein KDA53_13740 [Hyphomonas sp.]|nr:hypothetical protein [Hyphomonas sp.]